MFDAGRGGGIRRRDLGEDGMERSGTVPHSGRSSSAIDDDDANDGEEGTANEIDDAPSLAGYL